MAQTDTSEQPFRDYRHYLLERYGRVLYRVPVDLGFGCPQRSGDGRGGCTFCGPDMSRAAHLRPGMPLSEQVARGVRAAQERHHAEGFIAYFQAGTATHAPLDLLRERVQTVLAAAPFPVVVFATRPDCLHPALLDWLATLREHHEVWVELGVQSGHDATLLRIHRGHDVACVLSAAQALHRRGILTAAQVILGLPGEGIAEYTETARRLREGPFAGIKIHNLHVVRGSDLEPRWRRGEVETLDEHAYGEVLMDFLRHLPAQWPVMRLAADTPAEQLLAPRWWMTKGEFRQYVLTQMQRRGWRQGDHLGTVARPPAPAAPAALLCRTRQLRTTGVPKGRCLPVSPLSGLLQAARVQLHDSARGAVVLAIGFGEGPLALDGLDLLSRHFAARITLHGLSDAPQALATRRGVCPDQDGCLAALAVVGHCQRAWGRAAVHWGDPRRTVVRVSGRPDLVIMEPERIEDAPGLYTLDFLRRVVRLMGPGAVLVSACSSARLRGALLRLGLTVGRAGDGGRIPSGTVASWSAPQVLFPLPEHERRNAQESTAGIAYRDRALNWPSERIRQYLERLCERMRRRGLPSRLEGLPEPAPPVDPSQEDACA